jgi:hypothetical protein
MCEVSAATSSSGGASHIGLQLGEVADLKALTFNLAQMFI